MNVVIDLQQVSLIPPVVDFAVPPRVEEDDGKEEHNHHYNDTDQTEHPLLTTPGRGSHYKECCPYSVACVCYLNQDSICEQNDIDNCLYKPFV